MLISRYYSDLKRGLSNVEVNRAASGALYSIPLSCQICIYIWKSCKLVFYFLLLHVVVLLYLVVIRMLIVDRSLEFVLLQVPLTVNLVTTLSFEGFDWEVGRSGNILLDDVLIVVTSSNSPCTSKSAHTSIIDWSIYLLLIATSVMLLHVIEQQSKQSSTYVFTVMP